MARNGWKWLTMVEIAGIALMGRTLLDDHNGDDDDDDNDDDDDDDDDK